MSDTTPPDHTPVSPATPPALTPELAAARANWIRHGHDPARFDAALNGDTAPAAATPTGTPQVPAAKGSLTDAQVQAARKEWIAHGQDAAQFDAALKADGYVAPTEPTAAQIAQAEHDAAHGFSRKWEPSDYKIDYLSRGGRNTDPVALANANREITTFLANLQVDPPLGAAIAERVMDVSQASGRMSEAERTIWKAEQYQIVARRAGSPEATQERIRLAGVALRALARASSGRLPSNARCLMPGWSKRWPISERGSKAGGLARRRARSEAPRQPTVSPHVLMR